MIINHVEMRLWRWAEQVSRDGEAALGYSTHSCFTRGSGGPWTGIPETYLDAAEVERSLSALPTPLREAVVARYLGGIDMPKRTLYQRVHKAHKLLANLWGVE